MGGWVDGCGDDAGGLGLGGCGDWGVLPGVWIDGGDWRGDFGGVIVRG